MQVVSSGHRTRRLFELYEKPNMRSFLHGGGELHIAIERKPISWVDELYEAGHRVFSEKYVQGIGYPHLLTKGNGVTLNLYGHLQRNKVKRAVEYFDRIESVDSKRLADRISCCMNDSRSTRLKEILVQVNQDREPQKTGVLPEHAQQLIDHCLDIDLPLVGLMTIPPRNQDPIPFFRALRQLADRNGLEHCQMGMSDDWEAAIQWGATRLRLGRAVFNNQYL